jgi:RNA polymerase sigma-70 factor (ECF subfamily)
MDDKQLVSGLLRGDREDFRRFVDAYTGAAMAMALNMLNDREDAEDICQEVFIQVFRNLRNFDTNRSFKTWFYTIVYRRCLDHLKRRRRARELVRKMGNDPSTLPVEAPSFSAESKRLPSRLLDRLSIKERTALCLWANDGYTALEISQVLGCAASTARVYLFQARKKIKKLLEQDHVSLQNG